MLIIYLVYYVLEGFEADRLLPWNVKEPIWISEGSILVSNPLCNNMYYMNRLEVVLNRSIEEYEKERIVVQLVHEKNGSGIAHDQANISDDQFNRWMKNGGCPRCGFQDNDPNVPDSIYWDDFDLDGYSRRASCPRCEYEWLECYTMTEITEYKR